MSNLDKNSKPNGSIADPMQRLASFKAPRDLSLGGNKPNKKIFTPNLNVTRQKNKGPDTPADKNSSKHENNTRESKNFRKKKGPKVIKSSGVFSEGLGSVERYSSRVSYGSKYSEPVAALQKPTLRVRDFVKIDQELEEQKIKAATGENEMNFEVEDFQVVKDKDIPVKLPLDDGRLLTSRSKAATKVKQELVVKDEPVDMDCVDTDSKTS